MCADLESAIDWWLDDATFLPAGVLGPQQLQAAIKAAYAAAEKEDGTTPEVRAALESMPSAEAEAARAELQRMKLTGAAWLAELAG